MGCASSEAGRGRRPQGAARREPPAGPAGRRPALDLCKWILNRVELRLQTWSSDCGVRPLVVLKDGPAGAEVLDQEAEPLDQLHRLRDGCENSRSVRTWWSGVRPSRRQPTRFCPASAARRGRTGAHASRSRPCGPAGRWDRAGARSCGSSGGVPGPGRRPRSGGLRNRCPPRR
jgi:hypothetical protein